MGCLDIVERMPDRLLLHNQQRPTAATAARVKLLQRLRYDVVPTRLRQRDRAKAKDRRVMELRVLGNGKILQEEDDDALLSVHRA